MEILYVVKCFLNKKMNKHSVRVRFYFYSFIMEFLNTLLRNDAHYNLAPKKLTPGLKSLSNWYMNHEYFLNYR
jgi:hypothetical protein